MKKILLLGLLLWSAATTFAQCDKKLIFSSSKTEHIENGSVVRTEEEATILQFGGASISLSINGEKKGEIAVTSQTCNWTVPFKVGKSKFTGTMGEAVITITIEGKEGKIYLTGENESAPGNPIRLLAERFEEVK